MSKPILWHETEAWTRHNGGDCPIHRDSIVRFQFACGRVSEHDRRAGDFIWRRRDMPFDVVAYRVVKLGGGE